MLNSQLAEQNMILFQAMIFMLIRLKVLWFSFIYRPLYDIGDVAEHKLLLKRVEQTFPELGYFDRLRVYHNILKCVDKKHLVSLLTYSCKLL